MPVMPMRNGWVVGVLALALGCSARGGGSTTVIDDDAGPADTGTPTPNDTGTPTPNDTGTPSTDLGQPVECPAPRVRCGAACVDVRTDLANCGGCGLACTGGMTCQGAQCVSTGPTCNAPRTRCGDACVDTTSSTDHCGACNRACTPGQRCAAGSCQAPPSCTAPQVFCGVGCANTLTDTRNCGVCGLSCASDERCANGVCTRGTPPVDAGTPTGTSPAGRACAGETTACGSLMCFGDIGSGHCTASCTQGSTSAEQAQCGGPGGTCLQLASPNPSGSTPAERMGIGYCSQLCAPSAAAGSAQACRPGLVCTRSWLRNTAYMTETPGCLPHCTSNTQCTGAVASDGQGGVVEAPFCDLRLGTCRAVAVPSTLLPDGSPCNPQLEISTRQCRGACFVTGTPTQGLCGSFLNLATATSCPDDPNNIQPRAPQDDNLALCIFRDCTTTSQCGSGLICRYPEANGQIRSDLDRSCDYPTSLQPR